MADLYSFWNILNFTILNRLVDFIFLYRYRKRHFIRGWNCLHLPLLPIMHSTCKMENDHSKLQQQFDHSFSTDADELTQFYDSFQTQKTSLTEDRECIGESHCFPFAEEGQEMLSIVDNEESLDNLLFTTYGDNDNSDIQERKESKYSNLNHDGDDFQRLKYFFRLPSEEEFLFVGQSYWINSSFGVENILKGTLCLTKRFLLFFEKNPCISACSVKEGYLLQEESSSFRFKHWIHRYYSLEIDSIIYYLNEDSKIHCKIEGVIPLKDIYDVVSLSIAFDRKYKLCFELITCSGIIRLSGKTDDETELWMKAVKSKLEVYGTPRRNVEILLPLKCVDNIDIVSSVFKNQKAMSFQCENSKSFLFSLNLQDCDFLLKKLKRKEKNEILRRRSDMFTPSECSSNDMDGCYLSYPISDVTRNDFNHSCKAVSDDNEHSSLVMNPSSSELLDFYKRFNFSHELLIEVHQCTILSRSSHRLHRGFMYISTSYVCFYPSFSLGPRHKIVISFRQIVSVKTLEDSWSLYNGKILIETMKNQEFVFLHFLHYRQVLHRLHYRHELFARTQRITSNDIMSPLVTRNEDLYGFLTVYPQVNVKPRKIIMLVIGTRGDVQPFIAFAIGLQKWGHQVAIATHEIHRSLVLGQKAIIGFFPLAGDPRELIRLMIQHPMLSIDFVRDGLANFSQFTDDLLITAWEACKEFSPDVIIENPPAMAGIHIAEKMKVPLFCSFTMPWSRTIAFSHPFAMTSSPGGATYNYTSFIAIEQSIYLPIRGKFNHFRQKILGLDPLEFGHGHNLLDERQVPFLYCWSPSVLRKPPDWPDYIHITGYWFLDTPMHWSPSKELVEFLHKKPTPIYIGFGSVTVKDPNELTEIIVRSVMAAGQRAVISLGWGGLVESPSLKNSPEKNGYNRHLKYSENIFFVKDIPHDWLFPKIAAVVHHGGAGTSAAGFRAGKPTLIIPFFGDQFFWAKRVVDLGVGLPFITEKHLKSKLAPAIIKLVTDKEIGARASLLGERIRSQDGVAHAVECFHSQLNKRYSSYR